MNRNLTLYKKSGQIIPRAYMAAALAMFPTCIGFAVQDTEDGKKDGVPFLEVERSPKTASIDQIMKVQEQAKELNIIFSLGNITGDFNKEHDLQPFSFQTPDKQDILAVSIEGDFPDFVSKGHSDERNLWVDYLHPLLFKEYEASNDLGEFYTKIGDKMFKRQLMGSVGHRASIVMLPIIGDAIAHEKNELVGEYEWGAASQGTEIDRSFEKLEPVQAPAKEEPKVEAKKGRFSDVLTSGEKAPAPAETKVTPEIVHDATKQKTETSAAALEAGYMEVGPPPRLNGKALNYWYRTFCNGSLPSNTQKRPNIRIPIAMAPYAGKDISTKAEAERLQSEVRAFQNSGKTAEQMAAAHEQVALPEQKVEQKPAATEKTTASAIKTGESDPSRYLPMMKEDTIKKTQDLVLDYATRDHSKFPTPLELQKAEAKFATFTKQMGIKAEDMLRWRVEDIKALGAADPDALACAFIEMRAHARSTFGDLTKLTPANAEPSAPAKTEPEIPADKKVEKETAKHVAAKEALKPETSNNPLDFLKRPLKKAA